MSPAESDRVQIGPGPLAGETVSRWRWEIPFTPSGVEGRGAGSGCTQAKHGDLATQLDVAVMLPGLLLSADTCVEDALGAALLVHDREPGEVAVVLGPGERALLAQLPWPLRRAEWLAGRRVAKALLERAFGLAPALVDVLPRESGAPAIFVDGTAREDLVISVSHTRAYAVACVARGPVGVDVCDVADGPRIERIARRVFSEGEAEGCGAHASPTHQASVWALKEAVLKLHIGGVFDPGARSVRVEALSPPRVADPRVRVALYRLPSGMVAVAR